MIYVFFRGTVQGYDPSIDKKRTRAVQRSWQRFLGHCWRQKIIGTEIHKNTHTRTGRIDFSTVTGCKCTLSCPVVHIFNAMIVPDPTPLTIKFLKLYSHTLRVDVMMCSNGSRPN